jgi:hypothetical protein
MLGRLPMTAKRFVIGDDAKLDEAPLESFQLLATALDA